MIINRNKCIKTFITYENNSIILYIVQGILSKVYDKNIINTYCISETIKKYVRTKTSYRGKARNCYGEVQRFTLKNSRLIVCYSTKYYKVIEDDTLPSLLPDVNIALTIQNYVNNQDPCFEYIINKGTFST